MRQEHITSRQNPLLVHIRKLQASRSYRKASGEFAAEGTKLLEEAAKWYPGLHTVVCREGLRLCKLPEQVRVVTVPEDVFKSISTVDTPQGAIFLCRLPERQQADLTAGTLLLDGIQDPGNLGTILRTADALAVPVVRLPGCADVWNPKVVRASMGAAFSLNVRHFDSFDQYRAQYPLRRLFPFMLTGAVPLDEAVQKVDGPFSLVFGNEASGLPDAFAQMGVSTLIPHSHQIDSLNLAIAAGIGMYAFTRR